MSYFYSSKCHYDTLGVSVNASKEEIKRAYRRLCLETHPDITSNNNNSKSQNVKRFQQITEAHSILSNDVKRKRYDYERTQPQLQQHPRKKDPFHPRGPSSSQYEFLNGALRTRHLLMGAFLGISFVSIVNLLSPYSQNEKKLIHSTRTGEKQLIQAWKHPQTGKWYTPAPWDKTYQSLQPKLQYIPREQVTVSSSTSTTTTTNSSTP